MANVSIMGKPGCQSALEKCIKDSMFLLFANLGFVIYVKAIIYLLLLYNLLECILAKASLIKDLARASLTKVEIKK